MFFGNMQSFYRRNSVHNQSSSQSSKSKDQMKRNKHSRKHANEDDGDDRTKNQAPTRRSSFSVSRNREEYEPVTEPVRSDLPIIKIGMYEPETSKKPYNILKEKEKALLNSTSPAVDDNRVRLGPNKNNIIEETLGIERRRSADLECQTNPFPVQ